MFSKFNPVCFRNVLKLSRNTDFFSSDAGSIRVYVTKGLMTLPACKGNEIHAGTTLQSILFYSVLLRRNLRWDKHAAQKQRTFVGQRSTLKVTATQLFKKFLAFSNTRTSFTATLLRGKPF